MNKRFQLAKYDFGDYDKFHCLRPSWLLVAAILFLCRDLVLPFMITASAMGGASVDLSDLMSMEYLLSRRLAAVPAAIVLYALMTRGPAAPSIVQRIWRNGRGLLLVAVLSQLAIAIIPHWSEMASRAGRYFPGATIMAIETSIAGYVLFSSRVKDTFLDFPSA